MKETKIKFIDANYDSESGKSTATVSNYLGTFYGEARYNPADNCPSIFVGPAIAEMRASIKALKAARKEQQIIYQTLNRLYNTVKTKHKLAVKSDLEKSKVILTFINSNIRIISERIDKILEQYNNRKDKNN